jgi:hypothetical protein
MRRLRVATGLTLVAVACFLGVDATTRIKAAGNALAISWPYLLAGFAVSALLATLVEVRRLVGVCAQSRSPSSRAERRYRLPDAVRLCVD